MRNSRQSRSRFLSVIALAAGLLAPGLGWAETSLPLPNPGFEAGGAEWTGIGEPFSTLIAEAAHAGTGGLRVTDKSDTQGSSIRSGKVPVSGDAHYAVRFWARSLEKHGVGVYVEFWDAAGTLLSTKVRDTIVVFTIPQEATDWTLFTIAAQAPPESATLTVWVHSFNQSHATADLDDFSVALLTEEEAGKVRTTPTVRLRSTAFATPSAERIAEIAAMLPAMPRGLGTPIHDRKPWEKLRADEAAPGILAVAGRFAETQPPALPDDLYLEYTRTGNRRNYERPYQECLSRIECLVVAECMENGGRFLPAIERDIRAMCEHRSWLLPACDGALTNFNGTHLTVALGSSLRAWMLATALHWLDDRLPDELRVRTYDEIRRRVLDPYLTALRAGTTGGNWWMLCTNNWNAVCNAGVVGTALAIVPSASERAEFVAGMELSIPLFIKGFTDDGYCNEGVGYWNYGFGRFMMMGLMLRDATGGRLDLFGDPKLEAIARFPLNILIQPAIAPAFADCSVRAKPDSDVLALIDRVFPDILPGRVRTPRPLSGSILRTAFHALADHTGAEPIAITAEHLAPHSWFDQAGVLISRSLPGAEAEFGAAVKGGHNAESHNHNDVGSFVVALAGKPLLLDPGSEVYTRRTFSSQRYESKVLSSYGHPVPVVGGTLQVKGPEARGEILGASFSPEADRLVMEIASAYRVPALVSLVRTFVHDRGTQTITVEDHVRFREPTAFEACLVTCSRVHRAAPGCLAVYDDVHGLTVAIEVEGSEWDYKEEAIDNPGRPSPTRIGVALRESVQEGRVRFTIRPRPVEGLPGIYSEPTWEEETPDQERAITVQGEQFAEQTGGVVEVCDKEGAVGQAVKFWYHAGHRLAWRFEAPSDGRYALRLRCCHAWKSAVTRTVFIDGQPVGNGPFMFPFSGGWSSTEDNWRNVWLARQQKPLVLELSAGVHTLAMDCPTETGLNVDWLQLVPLVAR